MSGADKNLGNSLDLELIEMVLDRDRFDLDSVPFEDMEYVLKMLRDVSEQSLDVVSDIEATRNIRLEAKVLKYFREKINDERIKFESHSDEYDHSNGQVCFYLIVDLQGVENPEFYLSKLNEIAKSIDQYELLFTFRLRRAALSKRKKMKTASMSFHLHNSDLTTFLSRIED